MRIIVCLLSVLAVAGCGGSEPAFTREQVEITVTQIYRDQLEESWTMDQLECVEDGDSEHWKCFGYLRDGDDLYHATTKVTCDPETQTCLSEPQALTRS